MRKLQRLGAFLAAIALVGTGATVANAKQRNAPAYPRYDTKTETTIAGTVQEVREVPGPGRSTGIHVLVQVKDAVAEVHVGPSWYFSQQKYALAKGDQVEVTGSRVKYQGQEAVLAREIRTGGNTWTLRNEQGIPLWSRGRNR